MKITFCLPLQGWKPIGGFKVVYEYANHLAQRGHEITVVHPAILFKVTPFSTAWYKAIGKYIYFAISRSYGPCSWFRLAPSVRSFWVFTLASKNIPDADIIVATAWETVQWVRECPPEKGSKFYLIQHAELWSGTKAQIENTWQLPFQRVVISRWLQQELAEKRLDSQLIYNGLDHEDFYLESDIGLRNPLNICMLYHQQAWKGCAEAIAALQLVKKRHPGLTVMMFGNDFPDKTLPSWIHFTKSPSGASLRKIYNQAAIFVNASWGEGWGLTPCEAMQCGCAVAITAVQGHLEYAEHNVNALLSEAHDISRLADNICVLITNTALRQRLAETGVRSMKSFDWQKSVDQLEAAFFTHH